MPLRFDTPIRCYVLMIYILDLEEETDHVPDQEIDGDHVQAIEDQDLAHVMINVHIRKKKEAIGNVQTQC